MVKFYGRVDFYPHAITIFFFVIYYNNSWNGFHTEIMRIKKILQQNSFPIHVIDRTTGAAEQKNVGGAHSTLGGG